MFLPRYYNDEITINAITHFNTDEKLFELFYIENSFLIIFQNVAIYLIKYFVSHIMKISRNDTFL